LAQARALLEWHNRSGFCGVCGDVTNAHDGGHMRKCDNHLCQASHFPRTDPVVIMAIWDKQRDRLLLGRQKTFPPGVFSALAGFVEHGESIEDAVRREVWEETAVTVDRVTYHSSQPWPFPHSLMFGCLGEVGSAGGGGGGGGGASYAHIRVDNTELERAHWFTRQQVHRMALNWSRTLSHRVDPTASMLQPQHDIDNSKPAPHATTTTAHAEAVTSQEIDDAEFQRALQAGMPYRLPAPLAIAHQICLAWLEWHR